MFSSFESITTLNGNHVCYNHPMPTKCLLLEGQGTQRNHTIYERIDRAIARASFTNYFINNNIVYAKFYSFGSYPVIFLLNDSSASQPPAIHIQNAWTLHKDPMI